jgi:hypothetical protein
MKQEKRAQRKLGGGTEDESEFEPQQQVEQEP